MFCTTSRHSSHSWPQPCLRITGEHLKPLACGPPSGDPGFDWSGGGEAPHGSRTAKAEKHLLWSTVTMLLRGSVRLHRGKECSHHGHSTATSKAQHFRGACTAFPGCMLVEPWLLVCPRRQEAFRSLRLSPLGKELPARLPTVTSLHLPALPQSQWACSALLCYRKWAIGSSRFQIWHGPHFDKLAYTHIPCTHARTYVLCSLGLSVWLSEIKSGCFA